MIAPLLPRGPRQARAAWGRCLACLILVVLLPQARAQTLSTLLTNGPLGARINLVVFSEGYTTNQLAQFRTDATNLVNRILGAAPYSQYRSCFNAFAVAVASNQTGADHPSQGVYADTYFSATYDAYGVSGFLTLPPDEFDTNPSHGLGKITNLVQTLIPQCDVPILLVNDLNPGGSGGSVLVCSKGATTNLVMHELGHTIANLADEYATPFPAYVPLEAANATQETRTNYLKWKAWLTPGTPVPTPATDTYAASVGLFVGANYRTTGWYRPRLDCLMRNLDGTFCEICQEALVLSLYRKVRPVQDRSPMTTNLVSTTPQTLAFSVTCLPAPAGLPVVQWSLDNTPVALATQKVFQVLSAALSNGLHTVKAEVRDATALVRTDPSLLLRQTLAWQVQVNISNLRLAATRPATTNGFSVLVTGTASQGIVLETSTNLAAWLPVVTNAFTLGTFQYQEPLTNKVPRRYYRARALP
jgi:hypothetical protein